jgi:predicted  nucleic acid-binding Zn-ribbon protein
MLPEIEKLLVIQDRDRKIRALKQELKLAPLERKDLDEKLADAVKKLEAVKLKAKEIEVERKKLENEVQAKRDSIAKFQTQKFQTRKNEEFQALSNEIKRYEGEIQTIEDRELDLMESGDKAKVQIAETEKETKAVKEQVEKQLANIAAKIDAVVRNSRILKPSGLT